jgi:uncharacterized protein (DUF4415 family)
MRGSRRRIGSNLTKVDRHVVKPHEYEEAPEWSAEDFVRAEVREGARLVRRGRPPLEHPKQAVKLRLDPDVLERWRASGPGWQTRMNEALRRAAPRRKSKACVA